MQVSWTKSQHKSNWLEGWDYSTQPKVEPIWPTMKVELIRPVAKVEPIQTTMRVEPIQHVVRVESIWPTMRVEPIWPMSRVEVEPIRGLSQFRSRLKVELIRISTEGQDDLACRANLIWTVGRDVFFGLNVVTSLSRLKVVISRPKRKILMNWSGLKFERT